MTTTVHGNFVKILGIGVLITGSAGIGKSELTLNLIERGHQLICDDAPEFHLERNQLIGSCPALLRNKLFIDSVGLIDIKKHYSAHAIASKASLEIIINLSTAAATPLETPLRAAQTTRVILEQSITQLTLRIGTHRNLALLCETLVKSYQLQQQGIFADQAFNAQPRQAS